MASVTPFQKAVTDQLRQVAQPYSVNLDFEESRIHAVATFYWQGQERMLIIGDGELILAWDGEHYFETPSDPGHIKVKRFIEQFRLCLGGATATEAYRLAKRYTGPAG